MPPIVITPQMVKAASRRTGVPERVIREVLVSETGGGRWETSPAGAQGPAQLMPGTARGLEQRYGINTKTAMGNLLGGAYYLKEQLDRFDGKLDLALAAYNAGPGAVQKYGGIPPYEETQRYVAGIMSRLGGDATAATTPSPALSTPDVSSPDVPSAVDPAALAAYNTQRTALRGQLADSLVQANTRHEFAAGEATPIMQALQQLQRPEPQQMGGPGADPATAGASPTTQTPNAKLPYGARAMLNVIAHAKRMGLQVRENPYTDPVDPVHVKNSMHYSNFPGQYNGRELGHAADISGGDPEQLGALYDWVARTYPSLSELIYDPRGSVFDGQRSTKPYGGHLDHVHVGFS